jgi:hypothetical protein
VATVEDIAVCRERDWGGLLTSIVGFAVVNSAKMRVVRGMHERSILLLLSSEVCSQRNSVASEVYCGEIRLVAEF